jgi:hypothetical protein
MNWASFAKRYVGQHGPTKEFGIQMKREMHQDTHQFYQVKLKLICIFLSNKYIPIPSRPTDHVLRVWLQLTRVSFCMCFDLQPDIIRQ